MIYPVLHPRISSPYGWRILQGRKQFHDGIDFVNKLNIDRRVLSILDGVVIFDFDDYDEAQRWTNKHHSGGNMICVEYIINNIKYYARYLHLTANTVYKNQAIKEGQIVGAYGDVGYSFGAHLHFDLYDEKWKIIDPSFLLPNMEEKI